MEKESNASRLIELLGETMQNEKGRALIYELLEKMDCNRPNYVVSTDNLIAYKIGRRSVGEELLEMLHNDIDNGLELELLMRQEARARPQEKPKDPYDIFEGGME